MEDGRDAGYGTRAALVGSILGIVPAVGLGFLRFTLAAEELEAFPQLAGHIAFTLVYLAPYALVLMARAAPNPGVRGGLLLALGLLSLAASFSAFSLATLVFLPATVVIWFAAFRSLTGARNIWATALPACASGLLIAAAVGFAFYTLLSWARTPSHGAGRRPGDPMDSPAGRSTPVTGIPANSGLPQAAAPAVPFAPGNITADREAFTSMGVLAAGSLIMLPAARFRRADPRVP